MALEYEIYTNLQGCRKAVTNQASCNRGCGRRKPNRAGKAPVQEHRRHISRNWWSTRYCLDRYRTGIHNRELNMGLLKNRKKPMY